MEKEEYKYLHVPIQMMRGFVDNTDKTINSIVYYSALTFSQKDWVRELGDDYFIGQFIYLYHNDRQCLPDDLADRMDEYISSGKYSSDRNGFNKHGEFDPQEEIDNLKIVLMGDDYFLSEILSFCQFRFACDFLGVSSFLREGYAWAKSVENIIPVGTSTVMIGYDPLKEFLGNKKTEKEKMKFAVYVGICSIIGKKKYYHTNRELIFARALGYHSVAEIKADNPKLWEKYNTRKRIITFLEQLEKEKKVVFYTTKTMRGIHVGYCKKITYEAMVEKIQSKKIDDSVQGKRQQKRETERRIIEKLKEEKGIKKGKSNGI